MSCSLLHSFWRANLLLGLSLLLLQCGEARVHTEVQAGPLYRVDGSLLAVSCSVSGFQCETCEQDFEFRVAKPKNPNFELNIISTNDPLFGYSGYQARARNQDIVVERVSPTSVVFKIRSLQKGDEGEYDCSVVNSVSTYDGIYSAKTVVKVIDNSLSVSPPASTSLSFNEGEALTLRCEASSNTIQHTHLSLAWYLRRDGEDDAQPVISLDKDFTLSPGREFEGRYRAGGVSLDKLGEAAYRLTMSRLELSDRGKIQCQAREWIQDPDRSWYPIAQNDAEGTTLEVRARSVKPDTLSLVVTISAQPTTLLEGQELLLSCNIDAPNPEGRFFSVAWLRGGLELARMGPTGVLSVGPEHAGREKKGELRATRTGTGDYRLILQPVRSEDQGEYRCRAWPQERDQDGVFTQGASQDSSSQVVRISATESELQVEMRDAVNITEGGRLSLECKVGGVTGQLSVTWQYKPTSAPSSPFASVVSLSQDGVIEETEEFKNRRLRATRPAADLFLFELDEAAPSDTGVYRCAVSERETVTNVHSQARVTVAPLVVRVFLISRNSIVTVGDDVDLMCRIKGPRMPISVTWVLQGKTSTEENILTVYSNGAISWSIYQHHYQVKVENKNNEVIHHLQIISASHKEAGSYRCTVSIKDAHKKLTPSNLVAVVVQNPVNKLIVSSPPTVRKNINTDIEIKCSIISRSSAASFYAVTWLLHKEAGNETILTSDRNALVTFGPQLKMSDRQRISVKRTDGPSFVLTVRQARTSDKGRYICTVEEWLEEPRGDWYLLSTRSGATLLKVTEPANDLRLAKTEQQLNAKDGDEVELKCEIISGTSGASFFYKVNWLFSANNSAIKNASLVELDHTGLLSYPGNPGDPGLRGLQGRLRLSRPALSSFSLEIQRAREADSGTYWCQVEQYQLGPEGRWSQKASDSVGPITLRVNVTERADAVSESEHKALTWIVITVVVIVVSFFVILALMLKICKSKTSEEKKTDSFWTEEHSLKAGAGD